MAEHNAAQTDVTKSHSDPKTGYMGVFERREPLSFSPKRRYVLAVISPLQKKDRCDCATVFADGGYSEASSSAHSNSLEEILFERRSLTIFQPFSFDERDAARKVERERRLQEIRQMQERLWGSTFKAHPVRIYKPLIQHKDRTRPVHNSPNNV